MSSMTREELAARFMATLLERDPLAAQRFTEVEVRLAQLSDMSFAAAEAFLQAAERPAEQRGKSWDRTATPVPTTQRLL
jgi:hypothetical protein